MPYVVTFDALKSRAKHHGFNKAGEIEHCNVRSVAMLIDRYPMIVPPKYINGHIDCSVAEPGGGWLIEIDAERPRMAVY